MRPELQRDLLHHLLSVEIGLISKEVQMQHQVFYVKTHGALIFETHMPGLLCHLLRFDMLLTCKHVQHQVLYRVTDPALAGPETKP